jgi:hypothetical protein
MSTLSSKSAMEIHAQPSNPMDPTATYDVGNKELEDVCLSERGTLDQGTSFEVVLGTIRSIQMS